MITNKKDVLTFGKYKGKHVYEIIDIDPKYLVWLIDSTDRATFSGYYTYKIRKKANKQQMYDDAYFADNFIGFDDWN